MLGHKSCHVELVLSINSIFHARFHFLICFSRRMAWQHVLMLLKVNKIMHMVRPGKTRDDILLTFLDTLDQIRGDSDIQRPVPLARENVDCGLFCRGATTHGFPLSRE